MMKYDTFKKVVAEQILSYMPETFYNYEVLISSVKKVNHCVDTLNLVLKDEDGEQVTPTMSVNKMYEEYKASGNLQATLKENALCLAETYKKNPLNSLNFMKNILENPKENIVMMLINTEQNKELLQTIPHREFQDLSIVYRLIADIVQKSYSSALITNKLAEHLEMDEQTLYTLAVENTEKLFPPVVRSMNDIMAEIFSNDGMPKEIVDMMLGEKPDNESMYVISNERKINGAVSMLYENQLQGLAEKLGTDLYILPSSIHEVIAVSSDLGEPEELARMVSEINMDQVDLEERLSNQVYYYDKYLRKVTMVTNILNKRLDL